MDFTIPFNVICTYHELLNITYLLSMDFVYGCSYDYTQTATSTNIFH